MFINKILRFNFRVHILATQMLGFWPYFYDHRVKSYRTKWFLKCYPICLIMLVMVGLIQSKQKKIKQATSTIFVTYAANMVLYSINIAILVVFFSNYMIQINNYRQIEALVARVKLFCIKINTTFGCVKWPGYSGLVLIFLFKSIVVTIVIVCAEYQKNKIGESEDDGSVINGFLMIAPHIIGCIIPNWFYGGMLAAYFCFRLINTELVTISNLSNLNDEVEKTRHGRMKWYCKLSDRLDELAVLYMELCEIIKCLNRLCTLQIFIWMWYRVSFVVVQFFLGFILMSTLMTKKNSGGGRLVTTFGFGAAEIYFEAVDLVLVISICNYTVLEVGIPNVINDIPFFELRCSFGMYVIRSNSRPNGIRPDGSFGLMTFSLMELTYSKLHFIIVFT